MATALKLKLDIKKLKAAINSKATPKSFLPKLRSQLEKSEKELEEVKKTGKPPKKTTTSGNEQTLTALQKLIQKKKYRVYQGQGVDLEKDAKQGAFASGRRVSKGLKANQYGDKKDNKGNVYYEYRPNHLDVKQPKKAQKYPKLEKGGLMGKIKAIKSKYSGGGISDRYSTEVGDEQITVSVGGKEKTGYPVYAKVSGYAPKTVGVFPTKEAAEKKAMQLEKKNKFEDGGYMAKGGSADKPMSYYKYETPKVSIYWNGKKQPLGMFKSAEEAYEVVKEQSSMYGNMNEYEIHTPDKVIKLSSFANGGYMAKGGKLKVGGDDFSFLLELSDKELSKRLDLIRKQQDINAKKYFEAKEKGNNTKNIEESGERLQNQETAIIQARIRKNKYEDGGYMAKGGSVFSEKTLKDILDNALGHFYKGLNELEMGLNYLDRTGQGGMKTAFKQKFNVDALKESFDNIDNYLQAKKADGGYLAKGGRIGKDWNGRKSKETWGKSDLYLMYDNNLDLVADVHDYYKKMATDINEDYAKEMKKEMIDALQHGKTTFIGGATLTFAHGGELHRMQSGE